VYRKDVLAKAWQEVKANAGAAGIDERTIEDIEQSGVEGFLEALATDLREGRYRPRAVRRVWIPKPDGRQRPLGVPTIRDRVCQAAAKVVLEPIFEAEFRPSSYGFRPKRSAHQAGEQIRETDLSVGLHLQNLPFVEWLGTLFGRQGLSQTGTQKSCERKRGELRRAAHHGGCT